jgi:hypothetical protein
MTSERQIAANRRNAARSTGPRTEAGKAMSARNAVRHGVHARAPVIAGVERSDDWEAHRAGIVASLAPIGLLETRRAERAAELLWRLGRVARYECAVIAVGLDKVGDGPAAAERLTAALGHTDDGGAGTVTEQLTEGAAVLVETEATAERLRRLAGLRGDAELSADDALRIFEAVEGELPPGVNCAFAGDGEFLAVLGVPADTLFEKVAWTAALVRNGVRYLARQGKTTVGRLCARALRTALNDAEEQRAHLAALAERERERRARQTLAAHRERTRRLLPDATTEARLERYEGHLNRQLLLTLHELERLRACRIGLPAPLPVAVDHGVDVSGGMVLGPLEAGENGFVLQNRPVAGGGGC